MPNLIPQDIREWMRRQEFKTNDLTRRMSSLIPGDIADGVDLDGFMSSGRYRRASAVGTTTALHYPFNGAAGTLEVYWEPNSVQVQQVFYDRAGAVFNRWWNGTVWSAWVATGSDGLPLPVTASNAANQTIVSTTNGPLPTNLTASLTLPVGTTYVMAQISALIGSGSAMTPTATLGVRYWLSGAITFQPSELNSAAIGGGNSPISAGGGTLMQVHSVTLATATSLTIQARANVHVGSGLNGVIRGVVVQLIPLRRG